MNTAGLYQRPRVRPVSESVTPGTGSQTDTGGTTRLGPQLAVAYVPMQGWEATYEPTAALCRGTIFPSLDMPFMSKTGVQTK